MRLFSKPAEHIGYALYEGEKFDEWRFPNKKCGMGVSEDYNLCPYCGQRIKFKQSKNAKVGSD